MRWFPFAFLLIMTCTNRHLLAVFLSHRCSSVWIPSSNPLSYRSLTDEKSNAFYGKYGRMEFEHFHPINLPSEIFFLLNSDCWPLPCAQILTFFSMLQPLKTSTSTIGIHSEVLYCPCCFQHILHSISLGLARLRLRKAPELLRQLFLLHIMRVRAQS